MVTVNKLYIISRVTIVNNNALYNICDGSNITCRFGGVQLLTNWHLVLVKTNQEGELDMQGDNWNRDIIIKVHTLFESDCSW